MQAPWQSCPDAGSAVQQSQPGCEPTASDLLFSLDHHHRHQWLCVSVALQDSLHLGHHAFALERQDLSCMYLAHHELESILVIIIIIMQGCS